MLRRLGAADRRSGWGAVRPHAEASRSIPPASLCTCSVASTHPMIPRARPARRLEGRRERARQRATTGDCSCNSARQRALLIWWGRLKTKGRREARRGGQQAAHRRLCDVPPVDTTEMNQPCFRCRAASSLKPCQAGPGQFANPRLGQALLQHSAQGSRCLLYTSPSPRDGLLSRMPSSA